MAHIKWDRNIMSRHSNVLSIRDSTYSTNDIDLIGKSCIYGIYVHPSHVSPVPSRHALKVIAGLQAPHEDVRQLLKVFAPPKPTSKNQQRRLVGGFNPFETLVKMGIFPNFRGEHKKYLSCHYLEESLVICSFANRHC